jgi:hypothetical protein
MPRTQRLFDIDNALKCLIDVLGHAGLFAASTGGGAKTKRNTQDHLVHAVDAEKVLTLGSPRTVVDVFVVGA